MQKLVFENADGILSAGKVGASKVIRIFRTQMAKKENQKEAFRAVLVQDIQFLIRHQGEIERFEGKTKDGFRNSIVIAKHKNKTLSHIAINFYGDPDIGETFRLEVAGQDGLIEYDSDKSRPLILNRGSDSVKLAGDAVAPESDIDPQVLKTVDAIVNSLEEKI